MWWGNIAREFEYIIIYVQSGYSAMAGQRKMEESMGEKGDQRVEVNKMRFSKPSWDSARN